MESLYKMEVLSYCGLIDDKVSVGFAAERDRIIRRSSLTDEQIVEARTNGWKAGYSDWQNRGLGGFRNWCRTEGIEARDYFHGLAD